MTNVRPTFKSMNGDAPSVHSHNVSLSEKAKLNAWKSKSGIPQVEAMNAYNSECDRQIRVYGKSLQSVNSIGSSSYSGVTTPTNTPAATSSDSTNSPSPSGFDAIPLICAAAGETRTAYLERLKATPSNRGWWAKQEPLCADPGTLLSFPESVVIGIATKNESISLVVAPLLFGLLPSVLRSFLWPLHNVLLSIWIALIFVSTLVGSTFLIIKSFLFGSKRMEGVLVPTIFLQELFPSSRLASTLCEPHQAISIRLCGLALIPFSAICDLTERVIEKSGYVAGGLLYVFINFMTWWYWFCVLPWVALCGIGISLAAGCCFALIDFSGIV